MTILEAMRDPQLFAPWFQGATWSAWRSYLAATFGLRFETAEQASLYAQCTRRPDPPRAPARESWVIVGRRGGKSRVAALVATYLACFRDYRAHLAPGEIGTLPVIAADRRQARTIMRYIVGFFETIPMLGALVTNRTKETVELRNRVAIEVHTANFRTLRGYTLVAAVCDEIAFWRSDETSANPDTEIMAALRPGMASVPGALLLAISSPYARRGALWDAYRRHFGQDGPILVWQAPTPVMNPNVEAHVIADAYAEDESAARAEYGAEFRRDIEQLVTREAVEACVVPDRFELPPISGIHYRGFVDPSGGSQDSMTLAIAHEDKPSGRWVLDALRERRPPFSPADVVAEFSALLKSYRLSRVTGDRYAGAWPVERFAERGVKYLAAEQPKSDLYRDMLPLLNSGRVELLDHKRLIAQFVGLERRTARGGRDSIDHGPGGHDDLANATAGAIVGVKKWVPIYAH